MKKQKYWYKVDNAGKIFPAISHPNRSNVFRLSFYLDHNIDEMALQYATNLCLNRFQTMALTLRSGLFWNYLAENKNNFKVEKEPTKICKYFKISSNNGFLFKVYYLDNKVTLETFHAISDGTGAMEFLKSIIYKYYHILGYNIDHQGKILGEMPFSKREGEDFFVNNYDSKKKRNLKEETAYHLNGEKFKDDFTMYIKAKMNTQSLKGICKKYNVTISQYITALMAYSIYIEDFGAVKDKHPIKMFVPVNLRKYFNTITLRNCSLYIKSTYDCYNKEWTLADMLQHTKKEFEDQLVKEKLYERSNSNVGMEKNIFIRMLPLFLKNIAFKIGYQVLGENINTVSFSNLGIIDLPDDLKDKILDADFSNSGNGIQVNALSLHDTTTIFFSTNLKDMSIISTFIKYLVSEGLELTIDTNYKEEYDEIL